MSPPGIYRQKRAHEATVFVGAPRRGRRHQQRAAGAVAYPARRAGLSAAPGARGPGAPAGAPNLRAPANAPQNDWRCSDSARPPGDWGWDRSKWWTSRATRLPPTADRLRRGIELIRKLDFRRGLGALDDAAARVAATGGGGLDAAAPVGPVRVSRLGLRAWTSTASMPPAATARAQGYAELVRAAMVTPSAAVQRSSSFRPAARGLGARGGRRGGPSAEHPAGARRAGSL